jgi:hypothetical protein
MMRVQKEDFAQRIARIEAGKGHTRTTVFVGQEGTFTHHGKLGPVKKASLRTSGAGPLGIFVALVLGISCVGLVRYGVYRATGVDQIVPDNGMNWYLNGAAALAAALVVAHFIGLKSLSHKVYLALGVLAGVSTFHNLVHFQPQVFEKMFTPEWVADVTTLAPANTIIFQGAVFGA